MDKIELLQKMIDQSENIVFFGGAGVSTESGIKDFRSKDGLYSETYQYPPEYMLSRECFFKHTEEFYDFYQKKMNCLEALPNIVHEYLKKLEDTQKLKAIITQNIDGLHQKAGSKKVLELHGTIMKNYCLTCGKFYTADFIFNTEGIPKCDCGGVVKPNVVLYGEMLPSEAYQESIKMIVEADLLIVAGTSLTVEPASSLIRNFSGNHLVVINKTETPYDYQADLVIHQKLGDIFKKLHI